MPAPALNIPSIPILAMRLNCNQELMVKIAEGVQEHYHTFQMDFGNKVRKLYVAHSELKKILLAIRGLLREVDLPEQIIGGRKGCDLRDFARPHVGRPCILKLDIKDFFPSIGHRLVYHRFTHRLGCSPQVSSLLSRFVAPDGHAPQGFHTSTDIGNLALLPIVEKLQGVAEQQGFNLTVWVDNIVLSGGEKLGDFQSLCKRIVDDMGFGLSQNDVVHRTERQEICGVVVNSKLSVPEARRREISWMIHKISEGDLAAVSGGEIETVKDLMTRLRSKIGWVEYINREQGWPLRKKFDALPWDKLLQLASYVE